jgi:hypothetical protein
MVLEPRKLSWPGWATWAFLLVVASCIGTVAATLNDIW